MVWCGDDAVIIQHQSNTIFMVFFQTGGIERVDCNCPKEMNSLSYVRRADGARVQTKNETKFSRRFQLLTRLNH